MNKFFDKNELDKYLDDLEKGNLNLSTSIERKGKTKYLLVLHLLSNILSIEDITGTDILETYKFFIRIRRFIFKWINQIEDYMTSLVENNSSIDIKELYTSTTFRQKFNDYFNTENFYNMFIKKHQLYYKFIDYDDFLNRMEFLIKIRNWVCHSDLIYLNFDNNDIKFYSIKDCIENVKYFIWKEIKNGHALNKWKSYENQLHEILSNSNDGIVNDKQIMIFNRIMEYNFENCNIFFDKL